jgi:hypothetical protein
VRAGLAPGESDANLTGLDVERVTVDVATARRSRAAVRGCDVVYHLAAIYSLWLPDESRIYAVNVEGTKNVLGAGGGGRRAPRRPHQLDRRGRRAAAGAARRRDLAVEPLAPGRSVHALEVPVRARRPARRRRRPAGGDRVPGVSVRRRRSRADPDRALHRRGAGGAGAGLPGRRLLRRRRRRRRGLPPGGRGPRSDRRALPRRQSQRDLPRVLRRGDPDRRVAADHPAAAGAGGDRRGLAGRARGRARWPSAAHHRRRRSLRPGPGLVRRRQGPARARAAVYAARRRRSPAPCAGSAITPWPEETGGRAPAAALHCRRCAGRPSPWS